jgi:uncharacterized membrane protein (UPF0127 family)
MRFRPLLLFILLLLAAILIFKLADDRPVSKISRSGRPYFENQRSVSAELSGAALNLELATTSAALTKGLSGRLALPPAGGMLFIFSSSDFYGIWMKEMNFSIDIVWLDENFVVADLLPAASPDSYPQIFYPRAKSRFVIELPANFSAKNHIKIGDRLKIFPPSQKSG